MTTLSSKVNLRGHYYVIASEAKQSMTSPTRGSPRRCAPRDDGVMDGKHGSPRRCAPRDDVVMDGKHGSPRRCAPRDDGVTQGPLAALSFQGRASGTYRFALGAAHAV